MDRETVKALMRDEGLLALEREIVIADKKFSSFTNFYHERYNPWKWSLLVARKELIDSRLIASFGEEELRAELLDFDAALTDALRDMYDRGHRIWSLMEPSCDVGEGSWIILGLGFDYSAFYDNPFVNKDDEEFWEILIEDSWVDYDSGIAHLRFPEDKELTPEQFLRRDTPLPKRAEGREAPCVLRLTEGLPLSTPLIRLLRDSAFALSDFIELRDFYSNIVAHIV
jgi:hypothetical protein